MSRPLPQVQLSVRTAKWTMLNRAPMSDRTSQGMPVSRSHDHQETSPSARVVGRFAAADQGGTSFHRRSAALRAVCGREDPARLKIRALEVLLCLRAGDSNAEIADRLQISVSTVKYHLAGLVQSRQRLFG